MNLPQESRVPFREMSRCAKAKDMRDLGVFQKARRGDVVTRRESGRIGWVSRG